MAEWTVLYLYHGKDMATKKKKKILPGTEGKGDGVLLFNG